MTFAFCDDLSRCECWAWRDGDWTVVSCFDRNALRHKHSEWNSVDDTVDDQPIETAAVHQRG